MTIVESTVAAVHSCARAGVPWVLFRHGTCVFVPGALEDVAEQAKEILRGAGPVQVATPSADFTTFTLTNGSGWVIRFQHPHVMAVVLKTDVPPEKHEDWRVGVIGRTNRAKDAQELQVVHVERGGTQPTVQADGPASGGPAA